MAQPLDPAALTSQGPVPEASLPQVHPPMPVLELAELVVDGTLPRLPEGLVELPDGAPAVVLQDAEGTPVAEVAADGAVRGLQPFSHPPLRSSRLSPAQVRGRFGEVARVAVPVAGPLTAAQVGHVVAAAASAAAEILWFAVVGQGPAGSPLSSHALFRAVRALADDVGGLALPLALPEGHAGLVDEVARGYGAGQVVDPGRNDAGALHPAFAAEVAREDRRPPARGLVVFLTGLSGSGKSTVAKTLHERLLDDGRRTVTMLDGDEVRRMLSAGLGFGRADRDLNIRRIGWVAAEITRHGGLAICAPIAPFADVRAEVRAMVEDVGDFVLVHVATPLEECERRDRKGLYAKARAGLVAEFTGISSPYEDPDDADLVLDTSDLGIEEGVAAVWNLLDERGYLGEVDPRR